MRRVARRRSWWDVNVDFGRRHEGGGATVKHSGAKTVRWREYPARLIVNVRSRKPAFDLVRLLLFFSHVTALTTQQGDNSHLSNGIERYESRWTQEDADKIAS